MRYVAPFLCLLLTGCVRVPSVSAPDAAGIEAAALVLLARTDSHEIPSTEWPKEIRALDPKSVRIAPVGIYIVTSSFFVEEAGVFIPRNPADFSPLAGSDPEYRIQHGHVYSYRIRG